VHVRQAVRRLVTIGVCVVVLAGLSATAEAAPALGPPTGWPDLAAAAIAPTSLNTGARVSHQGYVKPDSDSLAEYDRAFKELTVTVDGKKLIDVEDDVSVGRSATSADTLIAALPLGLLLVSGQIGKEFAKESGLKVTYTKVGKPSSLATGDNSVATILRIGTRLGEIRAVFAVVRVGQVDSAIFFVGMPRAKIGLAEAKVLARLAVTQVKTAMAPRNTALPTISGSAAIGQTLGGLAGTWLSFPTASTFQWERCDATGANCTDVAGATSQSYVVTAADANSTLRLVVEDQNRYGSATATSLQTSVVAAPAGPTGPPATP
jgi:hypothetical protein